MRGVQQRGQCDGKVIYMYTKIARMNTHVVLERMAVYCVKAIEKYRETTQTSIELKLLRNIGEPPRGL